MSPVIHSEQGSAWSGKSSVLQAGLIPYLQRPDGDLLWEIIKILPGKNPLDSLVSAFFPFLEPMMTTVNRDVKKRELSTKLMKCRGSKAVFGFANSPMAQLSIDCCVHILKPMPGYEP